MRTLSSIALLIVGGFVALSLQGCGCNKEEAKKCLEDKMKEMTTSISGASDADAMKKALCKAIEDIVKCITDNGCCDEEDDGKKMKDGVNALVDTYKSYGCDIKEKCE